LEAIGGKAAPRIFGSSRSLSPIAATIRDGPSRHSPALYLGATIDAVIIEMTHGFARRLEPLTMVSYDVDVEDIVDLSSKSSSRLRCLFRGTSQQTLIVCRHGRYWRYCGRGRLNPECRAPTRMTPS
jgi:hypothetical protein